MQANAPGRDPEAELQLQLARKLGLKKGKTAMGGDGGLDEFLEGERACLPGSRLGRDRFDQTMFLHAAAVLRASDLLLDMRHALD